MTTCSRCRNIKPDTDFYKHTETGLPMRYCKECLKEYNRERLDKEKAKAYQRNYYLNVTKPLKKRFR